MNLKVSRVVFGNISFHKLKGYRSMSFWDQNPEIIANHINTTMFLLVQARPFSRPVFHARFEMKNCP